MASLLACAGSAVLAVAGHTHRSPAVRAHSRAPSPSISAPPLIARSLTCQVSTRQGVLALVRGTGVVEVRCDEAVALSVTASLSLYSDSARAGTTTPALAECPASSASCTHRTGTLLSTTLPVPVVVSARTGQPQALSLRFLQAGVLRRIARLDYHALARLSVTLRLDGVPERASHALGTLSLPPACAAITFTGPPPGTGAITDLCSGRRR